MDLFATRQNIRVWGFVGKSRDQLALAADALLAPRSEFHLVYAFLPITLLHRLIKRIGAEGVPTILVGPDWLIGVLGDQRHWRTRGVGGPKVFRF